MEDRKILTERLELIQVKNDMVKPLLKDKDKGLEIMGLRANKLWPTKDTLDVLGFLYGILDRDAKNTENTGFDTIWIIVKKEDNTVIGDLGFKGNPDDEGTVEIGYGIVELEQRKGYGYEAVKALVDWEFSHSLVKRIKAECLKDNTGSIRILEKIGMEVLSRNDEYIFWKLDSPLKIQKKKYIKSSLVENREFFEMYIKSLSSRYDDFLEEHILGSKIYSIYSSDAHIGYFGVYKSKMLTQFVIPVSELRHAQSIFTDVLKVFEIKNAFVPTCDELLLSLCLDNHKKINMQAYFFEYSDKLVRPAEYRRELLCQATLEDLPEIISVTGDFIDRHEERIKKGELYILRENGEFLGMGVIVDNAIMKNCKGTGMFTNEKHRQKGVGRSIILHLKDICYAAGVNPIPGCWYYNHNSKRTLESAGYVTKTRLLNIEF